jgi:MFS family permease
MLLGRGFLYAFYPVFWAMPTMILSESAAAATFGLITSVSQLGGFAGLYVIGFLNDRTHSPTAGFGFIALAYVAAGGLVLSLRIHYPEYGETKNEAPHKLPPTLPEPQRPA